MAGWACDSREGGNLRLLLNGNGRIRWTLWIPAFAGMTGLGADLFVYDGVG